MSRTYNLDPNAAKEANSGGKRITESGSYTGKIRSAWAETNERGTESVNILFEADNGQEAGPLNLYTHNGKGEELPSFKTLCAIMACLRLRSMTPKPGPVELYDYDQQKVVTKTKDVFQEMAGKPIGFVLQQEEYEKRRGQNAGEIGTRLVIFAAFDPRSRQTAEEILNKATEAKALEGIEAWVEKNPVKLLKRSGGRPEPQQQGQSQQGGFDDFQDDDIPF